MNNTKEINIKKFVESLTPEQRESLKCTINMMKSFDESQMKFMYFMVTSCLKQFADQQQKIKK